MLPFIFFMYCKLLGVFQMKFKILIALFFSLFCFSAWAEESPAPLAMLEKTSNQLISELKKNQAQIKTDPAVINQLISRIVLPHFDIEGIARSTIGQGWKQATPAQWSEFKKKVLGLVMKNYSAPLASFDDDQVKFFPMRRFSNDQTQVEVKSLIIRKNGQKIPVTYRVFKSGNHWKVSDFSVEGISMVQSYRSQFAPVLSDGGFNGLLQKLESRKKR